MAKELERPKFLPSLFRALSQRTKEQGFLGIIPGWFFVCAAIGAAISYYFPANFWSDEKWDVSTTVFGGLLTFNGLMLALSWNAFSRIHEIICSPVFCAYLRSKDMLNDYIVYIGFVHFFQILAITLTGLGLVTVFFDLPGVVWDRVLLAFISTVSIYSVKQGAAAVTVLHDLMWLKSIFDEHHRATPKDGKVVNMSRGDEA